MDAGLEVEQGGLPGLAAAMSSAVTMTRSAPRWPSALPNTMSLPLRSLCVLRLSGPARQRGIGGAALNEMMRRSGDHANLVEDLGRGPQLECQDAWPEDLSGRCGHLGISHRAAWTTTPLGCSPHRPAFGGAGLAYSPAPRPGCLGHEVGLGLPRRVTPVPEDRAPRAGPAARVGRCTASRRSDCEWLRHDEQWSHASAGNRERLAVEGRPPVASHHGCSPGSARRQNGCTLNSVPRRRPP